MQGVAHRTILPASDSSVEQSVRLTALTPAAVVLDSDSAARTQPDVPKLITTLIIGP